ncbi:MAG TPA: DUF885 domain-containing protein [Acidimicrobiia bacterium]|nr:DUF885 domain-containing protein [Acidimicrobiia bacterium]
MTLESLADRYWMTVNEYNPTIATVRGVHDFDDRLRSFDDDWLGEMASRFAGIADEAEKLPGLAGQARITRALLIHECRTWVTDISQRYFVAAIDPYLGPHTRLLSDTRQNTVQTMEQADALLGRYGKVGNYLVSALAYQRANANQGLPPAAASLNRVISQLDGYLASGLDEDPFLQLKLPEGSNAHAWREEAERLVNDVIRPAMAEYRAGLVEHIAPVARPDDKAGLMWIPGGEEIYAHLIHKFTQLHKPAQEIHDLGLEWATEINADEWAKIGQRAFGLGTMEEVFERLHNDPSLRFTSEEEMLTHARGAVERAWEAVDDWFGARPVTPCDVVPVPAATAPAMPPAYYMQPPIDGSRPGTYFLNTYKPEERDRFEYESIHFHEAIPGHHFDRSLAAELEGIPTFRRYAAVYAHTEGWGLYSERLADEMGLYSSDVDRLGMISADAWRAGRLVVDTGLHALGWSRQQAIDFLRRWTPIGLLTIEQEVDRYIGMAGQALSYKMGQLEIRRLRAEAERRLGDAFDIKGFHDQLLTHGAMPLPLLADTITAWIQ